METFQQPHGWQLRHVGIINDVVIVVVRNEEYVCHAFPSA